MEAIDNAPLAAQWVEALTARGVTLKAKGKRLEMVPANAYKALSDDERLTLRQHKAAIVALVRQRHKGIARGIDDAPVHTPPPPPKCAWCYAAPCIGVEHPAFFDLHPREAQQRADEQATCEMKESMRRAARGGDPYVR